MRQRSIRPQYRYVVLSVARLDCCPVRRVAVIVRVVRTPATLCSGHDVCRRQDVVFVDGDPGTHVVVVPPGVDNHLDRCRMPRGYIRWADTPPVDDGSPVRSTQVDSGHGNKENGNETDAFEKHVPGPN